MSNTSKTALAILILAFVLGVLGDLLLRSTPWGLNVAIWIAALALGIIGPTAAIV